LETVISGQTRLVRRDALNADPASEPDDQKVVLKHIMQSIKISP
jgi:hypothetical protein